MTYTAAIVGTGANPDDPDREGFAMAYRHGAGYERLAECELVACADIVKENAKAFAQAFDLDAVYEDYEIMLEETEPNIVSICVPPAVHAEIVIGCAESPAIDAVHCEKPMAHTWGDCVEMVKTCDEYDIQLTFNHQRRFGGPFRAAKSALEDGRIGDLVRVEVGGPNLFDVGSHHFDLCGLYTDQTPIEWVLAQVDYREENVWFGTHNENQAIAQWKYANGVHGVASTGYGSEYVGALVRLVGETGVMEIGPTNGPPLRFRNTGSGAWKQLDDAGDSIHGPKDYGRIGDSVRSIANVVPFAPDDLLDSLSFTSRAIEDVVRCLREGDRSELEAGNALQATELIFGAWESARRRGRIEFPLDIDDNPLEAMVASGALSPS